jgi:hypothetical protein
MYKDWSAERREVLAAAVIGMDVKMLRHLLSAPEEHPMKLKRENK